MTCLFPEFVGDIHLNEPYPGTLGQKHESGSGNDTPQENLQDEDMTDAEMQEQKVSETSTDETEAVSDSKSSEIICCC